jgi:methyl-accepting chemotaxis protein
VFIIFTAVTAVSVLIQASAIVAMFFGARETQKKVHALVEDFRVHVLPSVGTAKALIEDLSPKLKVITSNLVETSGKVRTMTEEVNEAVKDVTERARAQAAHVDGMVQGTLDHIDNATTTIQHGISVPLRQLNGILNGVRAGMNVMLHKTPNHSARSGESPENDLFI